MADLAIFTGDNHLRPMTWVKHPELRSDAYAALTQIVDICLERQLPLILLGDLFDKNYPDSLSVWRYTMEMTRMQQAGLAVYSIRGNHDFAEPAWAAIHPGVCTDEDFTISGVRFHAVNFTPARELAQRLSRVPDTDVVLAHQSWLEVQRVGHVDGSFSLLPRATTLLTGDYHVPGEYRGIAGDQGLVRAYSPGSTAMQALNERPDKYVGVLQTDLTMQWQQLVTRPYFRMECLTEEELQQCVVQLHAASTWMPQITIAEIAKPILHVIYGQTLEGASVRIKAAAQDAFHVFLVPRRDVQEVEVVYNKHTEAFTGMLDALAEMPGLTDHIRGDARHLLEADAPGKMVDQLKQDFLKNFTAEEVSHAV